jgi:hypothetical protein
MIATLQRPASQIAEKVPPTQLDRLGQELSVVRILKAASPAWVSRRLFLREQQFGGYDITQVASRIKTLRDEYGCVIDSKRMEGDSFVSYRWVSGPPNIEELVAAKIRLVHEKKSARAKQKNLPLTEQIPASDYMRRHREEEAAQAPLFAHVEQS